MTIKLINDTIDSKDMDSLADWIKTYPKLTKGELTVKFEEKFSNYLVSNHSVFVNSGSSANLLMLATLMESEIDDVSVGDSVVVPAISWATDLAPVMQLGLNPILCDCNLQDFSVDLTHLESIFRNQKPKVLLLVSVLGLVPDMEAIVGLCNEWGVILLEDTCESMGSEYKGIKLGNFGLMSSFSTYFGHHISTIEGGIVSTNSDYHRNLLLSLRSHGWDRDWDSALQSAARQGAGVDDFNALYTFYYPGFNLRSTDLNAFIGLGQLSKLPNILKIRNRNYKLYQEHLGSAKDREGCLISNFAYPLISDNRDNIVNAMKDANIEVRPLIAGSMARQPFYLRKYGDRKLDLPNADRVYTNGMYLPNHPGMGVADVTKVIEVVKSAGVA